MSKIIFKCFPDLAGITIQKNTSVVIDIIHMQRHPDLFDNPMEFRPERFDTPAHVGKSPFAWLAFSAGPRNCIGDYTTYIIT